MCNLVDGHDVNSSSLHSFVLVVYVYFSVFCYVFLAFRKLLVARHLHPSPPCRPPPPAFRRPLHRSLSHIPRRRRNHRGGGGRPQGHNHKGADRSYRAYLSALLAQVLTSIQRCNLITTIFGHKRIQFLDFNESNNLNFD